MGMGTRILRLCVVLGLAVPAVVGALPRFFYKRLEGTIGDRYPIVMHLTRIGDRLAGSYSYVRNGQPILFAWSSSISDSGAVLIRELGPAPAQEETGSFEGRLDDTGALAGTWHSADGSRSLAFSAVESYPQGSSRLDVTVSHGSFTGAAGARGDIEIVVPSVPTAGDADPLGADVERACRVAYAESTGGRVPAVLRAVIDDFHERFSSAAAQSSGDNGPTVRWQDSFEPRIIHNDNGIVSIAASLMFSEDAAYPSTYDFLRSYTLTGQPLAIDAVLTPGSGRWLDARGLASLKKTYHVDPGDDLSSAGLLVDDAGFHMTPQFVIARGGLFFRFSQGEIGPHALGAADVFIPYKDLAPHIRADGPLAAALPGGRLP